MTTLEQTTAPMPPGVSLGDVPLGLATRAHEGTSWTPDRRGLYEQRAYVERVTDLYESLTKRAETDDEMARVGPAFEAYRSQYVARYCALLGRRSSLISAGITGPSNFPVRRQQKRSDAYHKAEGLFIEWDRKARGRAMEAVRATPPRGISSDRADATDALTEQIKAAQARQQLMKDANAICRSKAGFGEKIESLRLLGIGDRHAHILATPKTEWPIGQVGFESWELSNNQANIRRLQARIGTIEQERSRPVADAVAFDGGTIEENREENRLQIMFDAKPEANVRATLKANGFRWAPSQGAWQRQLNNGARAAAHRVLGSRS